MEFLRHPLSSIVGLFACCLVMFATPAASQQLQLGLFEGQIDIGSVKTPGSTTYDAATQYYVLEGSGGNMWFDTDEFHMVWKWMSGDFILRANAALVGEGVDPHRKMGWMIRTSLDSSSAYVDVAVHGDGLTSMQFRRTPGAETEQLVASITEADVVQLARQGDTYTMSVARSGDPFVSEALSEVVLGDEVYVGLFVCAHNEDVVEQAIFHNVRIVVPPPDGYTPYRDYIGSNLEVMDVATGDRRIIYQVSDSFQAPNWTPDGEALIYVHNGLLYRFDLARRRPDVIDTGFATRNNNDHVLSFDGRMLGISHHSEEFEGQSIIYTVPVEGGTPKRITNAGPSYLHGWSPDGRFLTYTAQRNGDYDIYAIPSDGGEEIQLTTSPGLDDGSEYTPDGQYILFNSTRTGTMEIWRMKTDGSEQVQLTDDGFNNWFPHTSPDGKQILFLSYGDDVDPSDHPFYKHVYLRMMPFEGGEPRVVAYLYGGQGTINVPSWSPDGRQVAFVTNTAMY